MILVPNYKLFFVLSFINGVTYINKGIISYAHFVENLGTIRSTKFTSWLFFIDSINFMISPFYLMVYSKNALVFVYVALFFCVILGFFTLFRGLPESLKF